MRGMRLSLRLKEETQKRLVGSFIKQNLAIPKCGLSPNDNVFLIIDFFCRCDKLSNKQLKDGWMEGRIDGRKQG